MNIPNDVVQAKNKLENIINDYLSDSITLESFEERYSSQLELFEEVIADNGLYQYYATASVVPSLSKSKMLWKQDRIWNLKNELKELENTNHHDLEDFYSLHKLDQEQRKQLCKDALFEINMQVRCSTVHNWIQNNLVEGDFFKFLDKRKKSKFGKNIGLYKTPVMKSSFLLSALSRAITPPPYLFEEILQALQKTTINQECFWVQCSEVDGVYAQIEVLSHRIKRRKEDQWSLKDPYEDTEGLIWFEGESLREGTQSGDCHLLLLSSDYSWVLKLSYNFEEWSIELHGNEQFLSNFQKQLSRYTI